ncbi:energy transducer TonB [Chitinimonas sp. PSY-7]|uniref:TonB family protein n=1 Tax=Chitinimonas sp. PSY-7 TaxID=3459088 RepID=UPI004040106D
MSCALSLSVLLHIGFLLFAMQGVVSLQSASPRSTINAQLDLRTPLTLSPSTILTKTVPAEPTPAAVLESPIEVPAELPPPAEAPPAPQGPTAATDSLTDEQPVVGELMADSDAIIQWQDKLLLIGQTNLPTGLDGVPLQGEVRVRLEVRADGSLVNAVLINGSGQELLDEAALNLVRMASPFARADGRTELSLQESNKTYVYETTWVFPGSDSSHI